MDYDFRLNRITSPGVHTDPSFRAWITAVRRGFHQDRPTDVQLEAEAALAAEEGWALRGVHATESPDWALGVDEPVATFCEWTGELSLGGGRTLPLHQISEVTVRPTHRRQGLLRRLMTESLTEARDAGIPVAGLTVTEATIYGRFGFAPATTKTRVEVDAGPRFGLRNSPGGRVEFLTLDGLAEVTGRVFDGFHRDQAGSVRRTPARTRAITGAIDRETSEPSRKMRAAGHWNDAGVLDGYVTWLYRGEFTHQKVAVLDLVATDERAELALWEFVCSIDLVEKATWEKGAVDDPLPWAMSDRRGYSVTGSSDDLWLRVLDPVAAFGAREYVRDGDCSFRVVDPMGFADGVWTLTSVDGVGYLAPATSAELELDVQVLGSILLGGVHLSMLHAAGLIRGPEDEVDRLNTLLQSRRAPHCLTQF